MSGIVPPGQPVQCPACGGSGATPEFCGRWDEMSCCGSPDPAPCELCRTTGWADPLEVARWRGLVSSPLLEQESEEEQF